MILSLNQMEDSVHQWPPPLCLLSGFAKDLRSMLYKKTQSNNEMESLSHIGAKRKANSNKLYAYVYIK